MKSRSRTQVAAEKSRGLQWLREDRRPAVKRPAGTEASYPSPCSRPAGPPTRRRPGG
jgi:hypothetical protein